RFGHAHEQGPRDHRGALAVRRAVRAHRGRRAPPVDRARARAAARRCPARAPRPARHARPDRLRAGLSAPRVRRRPAAGPHARALAHVRAGRRRDVPLPRARARRRPLRRSGPVRPERGRRGGRGGVPGRALPLRRHPGARRACTGALLERAAECPRAGARRGCGGPCDGARGASGRGARLSSLIAIGGLLALVFIHELGHFVVAKAVGMRVTKFYVGFPPAVVKRSYGETEYGIGLIPLGGFVRIVGMGRPRGRDLHSCGEAAEKAAERRPPDQADRLTPALERARLTLDAGDAAGSAEAMERLSEAIERDVDLIDEERVAWCRKELKRVAEDADARAYWRM